MKIALEGRMDGNQTAGRPRRMLLDWMFHKDSKWKYQNVKQLVRDRDACTLESRTCLTAEN